MTDSGWPALSPRYEYLAQLSAAGLYSLTSEVYWRLLARMNESFWSLQLVTIMLGIALLLLALKQCGWRWWGVAVIPLLWLLISGLMLLVLAA